MTVWFPKSTLSKSVPHPKQTKMNRSQNENLKRVSKKFGSRKIRYQQTMLVKWYSTFLTLGSSKLEPILFFFCLAYSIKYFVRSFISSMEIDLRDFVNMLTQVFRIRKLFMAHIESITLSCILSSRWSESYLP